MLLDKKFQEWEEQVEDLKHFLNFFVNITLSKAFLSLYLPIEPTSIVING